MENLERIPITKKVQHSPDFLRRELGSFQRGEAKIGWDVAGAELKRLNVADLQEEDLIVFDDIENCVEIDDQKVKELEAKINQAFAGVEQKRDVSRYEFKAFLKNLILSRWGIYRAEKRNKTLH